MKGRAPGQSKFVRLLRAVSVLALLLPLMAAGEDALRFERLTHHDEFRDDGVVDVRGRVIAGLRVAGDRKPGSSIRTRLGRDAPAELCVRVITADGLYSGEAHFQLQESMPAAGAMAELQYLMEGDAESTALSEYQAHVRPEARDFAALITPGDCSPRPLERVLIGTWEADDAAGPGVGIELLVNGLGATEVRVSGEGIENTGRCVRASSGRRVGFDFNCGLSVLPGASELDLSITLRDLGAVTGRAQLVAVLP